MPQNTQKRDVEIDQPLGRVLAVASVLAARLLVEAWKKGHVRTTWNHTDAKHFTQTPPIPSCVRVREWRGKIIPRKSPTNFREYQLIYVVNERYHLEMRLVCYIHGTDPLPKEIGVLGPKTKHFRWWKNSRCDTLLEKHGLCGISYWEHCNTSGNAGGAVPAVWYVP